MITMIAAIGANHELGKNNNLVWHLPNDFKRFKTLTSGHCIIMGRKTFESFPKLLPNRKHIVITRNPDYQVPEEVIVVQTMDEAIAHCQNDPQPFIIGGGEIYRLGMEYAECLELTHIEGSFDCDTFFPEIDHDLWQCVSSVAHEKDERHHYAFRFNTYKRK
ncbi:MAG TPA: diacylglycerol kinase [Flavobacteriaceae bacterium]|nr:diacylglycerol kinase [Flavobacteriaceae bacterium]